MQTVAHGWLCQGLHHGAVVPRTTFPCPLSLLHSIATWLWCDWVSIHVSLMARDFKHFCLSSLSCIFSGMEILPYFAVLQDSGLSTIHVPSLVCSCWDAGSIQSFCGPKYISFLTQTKFVLRKVCLSGRRKGLCFFCNLSVNIHLFHKMPFIPVSIVLRGDHCSLSGISWQLVREWAVAGNFSWVGLD